MRARERERRGWWVRLIRLVLVGGWRQKAWAAIWKCQWLLHFTCASGSARVPYSSKGKFCTVTFGEALTDWEFREMAVSNKAKRSEGEHNNYFCRRSETWRGLEEVMALKQRHTILQTLNGLAGNQWSGLDVICALGGWTVYKPLCTVLGSLKITDQGLNKAAKSKTQ